MLNHFITLTGSKINKLPEEQLVKDWFSQWNDYIVVQETGSKGDNPHYHGFITEDQSVQHIKRKVYKDLYNISSRGIKDNNKLAKCVARAGEIRNVGYIFKENDYRVIASNLTEEKVQEIKTEYAKINKYKYLRVTEVPRTMVEYSDINMSDPLRECFHEMVAEGYCTLSWKRHSGWICHEFYRLFALKHGYRPTTAVNRLFNETFGELAAKHLAPLPPMTSPPPLHDRELDNPEW